MRVINFLGQRGGTAIVTLILFVIAVAMGQDPGTLPIGPDGNILSPEFLGDLLAPLGAVFVAFHGVFKVINRRIDERNLDAGDFLALLKMKEFWVYVVTVIVGLLQVAGIRVLHEEQQMVLANAAAIVFAMLLRSWGDRHAGEDGSVVG